jgi:glycosyltransferase involved in cell wall biosynthesis
LIYDYKYISKFDFVFGFSQFAVDYYRSWSSNWKVFPFAYCVKSKPVLTKEISSNCKIVYAGSLTKRKNVILLINALNKIKDNFRFQLDIIGDGVELEHIKSTVNIYNMNNVVNFLGTKKIEEIPELLSNYDALVLPSLHDGWGAVINEALNVGSFIICSDACGAKTLIHNSNRGLIFKSGNVQDLLIKIKILIEELKIVRMSREDRKNWAVNINGKSISMYFINCLFNNGKHLPPWQ